MRSRFGFHRRAFPARASMAVEASSSPGSATISHQYLVLRPPCPILPAGNPARAPRPLVRIGGGRSRLGLAEHQMLASTRASGSATRIGARRRECLFALRATMRQDCGRQGLADKATRGGGAAVTSEKAAGATSVRRPDQADMGWEYAPAPESREIVSIAREYGLFVNGEFSPAQGSKTFATVNPATEEPLARVALAGGRDVDRAVSAARTAYEQVWGPMPGAERAKYLYRIARILQERSREFAVLESIDNGKPIKETRDVDIPLAAAHFFYYAGWADKLDYAGFGPQPRSLGVAGQVIPWNFPLLMAAWKLAPALAAGNTCVLKPAETTPLSAL